MGKGKISGGIILLILGTFSLALAILSAISVAHLADGLSRNHFRSNKIWPIYIVLIFSGLCVRFVMVKKSQDYEKICCSLTGRGFNEKTIKEGHVLVCRDRW